METKSSTIRVLYRKMNDYFKDNIKLSIRSRENLVLLKKKDLFYCIDIKMYNKNIPYFIIKDDNSVIESMIIKDLCHKQIIDINIRLTYSGKRCFARNRDKNIYLLYFKNEKVIEYMSDEKIIDMCCGKSHSLLLTQSGKVYEFIYFSDWNELKDLNYELKYLKSEKCENEKIVMMSCGLSHSIALTQSGQLYGWDFNNIGQLGFDSDYI
jgi:hypothetical protein